MMLVSNICKPVNIKLYFVLSVLILSASGMMQNNAFAVESADLGTAEPFVILSGGVITVNTAPNQPVTGDTGHVGALTGSFSYPTSGSDFAGAGLLGTPATPGTPLGDARTVYDDIGLWNGTNTGLACTFTFPDGAKDLATADTGGGVGEYGPGVYCINGAASIGGAGININATGSVVFKINGAFTTVTGSSVTFNGTASSDADSGRLFFVSAGPAPEATLSANTQFSGNVMTGAGAITTGANINATNARFISESAITITDGANTFSILTPPAPVPSTPVTSGGSDDHRSNTKPTFGTSYQTNKAFVTDGFGYGTFTKTITDNFHTAFDMVDIQTGIDYPFYAKGYYANGLKTQEFCFGVPEPGKGYLAESCVEVHFDYGYGDDRKITDIKVIQNSQVVGNVSATHDMASCTASDKAKVCDKTMISVVFLEPLQHKVMMIKGIDEERFVAETYLNHGFNIDGKQLTELPTAMIPSPVKYEGLIKVTQSEKYSNIWISDDKRVFERNNSGSFNQINQTYERHQDTGDMKNRTHSAFAGWKDQQAIKAKNIWDASKYVSTLAPSFIHDYPVEDSRTTFLKEHNMLEFARGQ